MLFFYENHSLKSGIYEIRNRITNKSYIGQAQRFKERWMGHKNSFLRNKNKNKHFQNSFNKCFKEVNHDNFLEFHVLEIMENSTKEQRNKQEEYWIEQYLEKNYKLYNKKLKPTTETKINFISHTEETKKKLSEINKGNPGFWTGKTRPKETNEKISNSLKHFFQTESGKKLIEKTSKSLKGRNVHNKNKSMEELYGIERTFQIKKKLHDSKKGKYVGLKHPRAKIYDLSQNPLISPTGELYSKIECLSEFSRKYNLNPNHVLKVINGTRNHHKNWRLVNGK